MILSKIIKWYNGEQKVRENEPDSPIIRIGIYTERHWTANTVHSLVKFYINHWQWFWSTLITIIIGYLSIS